MLSTTPPAATPAPAPAQARSWEARYGQMILQAGIATIPQALFLYQHALGLTATQVWFIGYLLAQRWDSGIPHPALPEVAAATGVSVRQLQSLRKSLETRHYLQIIERYNPLGQRVANGYDFTELFACLEACITADPPHAPAIQQADVPSAPPAPDTSFIARYGRVLVSVGIAAIPAALFSHQARLGLSPQQVWFVAYILSYKWTTDLPYPSLTKMAARTGYTLAQIHVIKKSLVEQGYLLVQTRKASTGGRLSSAYDFSPLFEQLVAGGTPSGSASTNAPLDRTRPVEAPRLHQQKARSTGGDARLVAALAALPRAQIAVRVDPGVSGPLVAARGGPDRAGTSAVPSPLSHSVGTPPPYLERVLTDLSRELGDEGHTRANITQAHRLWRRVEAVNGLTAACFVTEFVQVARRRTRRAQGAQGAGQITNKMAYFFRILRELVDQQVALGPPSQPVCTSD